MRKLLFSVLIFSSAAQAQANNLWVELRNESLIHPIANQAMRELAKDYKDRNTVNSAYLNLFPGDNRSEVVQTRLGLENIKQADPELLVFDFLENQPLRWQSVTNIENVLKEDHAILAVHTRNINKDAPVLLIFTSNTHNLQSFLGLGLIEKLSAAGVIPVVMEYPGYGGSFGIASRDSWKSAGSSAAKWLAKTFQRKIFVLGHSIGGGVAFDVASQEPKIIQGLITHGTFYSALEMSKDQVDMGLDIINYTLNPTLTLLMAWNHLFNNGDALPVLAKNKVPVLVLHGEQDWSVPVRHLQLLKKEMASVTKKHPDAKFSTEIFQGASHEDIFSFEGYGAFSEIWTRIFGFIKAN